MIASLIRREAAAGDSVLAAGARAARRPEQAAAGLCHVARDRARRQRTLLCVLTGDRGCGRGAPRGCNPGHA